MIPEYSRFIDVNDDFFDLSTIPFENDEVLLHTYIDRAFIQWNNEEWEVKIGRQRINWGRNLVWNPNDIFNAYSFFDFDYEERPGSDAIRIQRFTGYAGGYEFAVRVSDSFDELVAAGLYKHNLGAYDIQWLGGVMRNNVVVGNGWAGSIWLVGFKGEISFFVPLDNEIKNQVLASVSADYSFPNSLYIHGSILYNSLGQEDPSLFDIQSNTDLDIRNISPFTYSTLYQMSYPINPLWNVGFATIYYPEDNSAFLNPSSTFSLTPSLDLDILGQIFISSSTPNANLILQG